MVSKWENDTVDVNPPYSPSLIFNSAIHAYINLTFILCFTDLIIFLSLNAIMAIMILDSHMPYFIAYKTEFFSFQNNPKELDPSCKMDLDLCDF